MTESVRWQDRLLEALLTIDREEAPHGLYGIRLAHAVEPKVLPSTSKILKQNQQLAFLRDRRSLRYWRQDGFDGLSYRLNTTAVRMRILNHAATKVRHFGSSFRLDLHNRKPAEAPPWDLERLIPNLQTPDGYEPNAILLMAHAATFKEIQALVGRAADPSFLDRYANNLTVREWKDIHGRQFHSALYLWCSEALASAIQKVR